MTKTQTGRRYGAYHRISRLNGRDLAAESTMTDKDAFGQIDGWAQMRGVEIVERYLDADVSGAKLDRPELNRLLEDLRAGVIDGIAVAQVDRLSRADVGDALAVVKEILEVAPGSLALLDLGIDPATEFGEFGLTILLGLSRMQWRRYKRSWETAQRRAVGRGVWIGPAPFGYERGADGVLARHPREAEILVEAFAAAGSGGLHSACALLAELAPERRWRTADARRILRSRVYLGETRSGELVNEHAHEPLVSFEAWQAAQTEPRARRSNGEYPLSGLATCEACGAGLVGQLQTTPDGRRYRRYRCAAAACKGGSSISADKLEGFVRSRLADLLGSKAFRVGFGAAGLEEAAEALSRARDARLRLATNTELLAALGSDAAVAMAHEATREVELAEARYQEIASGAARSRTLPAASELNDPAQLRLAVESIVGRLSVRRGRGSVDERVELVTVELDDLDGSARVAAA